MRRRGPHIRYNTSAEHCKAAPCPFVTFVAIVITTKLFAMNNARDKARNEAVNEQPRNQNDKETAALQAKKSGEAGSHREGEYERQDDKAGMNPGYIPRDEETKE